jgi:hypothetical protein
MNDINITYSYKDVPTIKRFAKTNKFIRGLMGPFGSGKSSGCVVEIVRRAHKQIPGPDGIRRSRWAVVRNTYPQLRDTTIKTFHQWLPPQYFGKYLTQAHDYYITAFEGIELEINFRALDRPDHVANLLSLELTGAWLNEAREIPWEIIDGMTGRVNRYPPKREGGATWAGIIMDTNPPDDDSEWYEFFEEKRPANAAIFKQPSGVSPGAENLPNLPDGYYENLAEGKDQEWIDVYVHGKYGMLKDGRPVYPEYVDELHRQDEDLIPVNNLGLILGWDFGLTPACAITQLMPTGQFRLLDEILVEDHAGMGIRQFSQTVVVPYLREHYSDWIEKEIITSYGDPAGTFRSQNDEVTCLMILNGDVYDDVKIPKSLGRALKIYTNSAATNSLIARIDAVKKFLNAFLDDEKTVPAFIMGPKVKVARKGFRGAYQYSRIQVTGEKRYKDQPSKNHYSHIHDAIQYAALMARIQMYLIAKQKSAHERRIDRLLKGDPHSYESVAAKEQAAELRRLQGFGIDWGDEEMDEYDDGDLERTVFDG